LTGPDDVRDFRIATHKGNDTAWILLRGEADISTLDQLETALERVDLDGTRSVHLDVSELAFVDAATIRRLTVFAVRARQAGHHVDTCGAGPTFRMVARLLGVRDHLRLV
jgi:anti-anti-sigma regulatory factor